MYKKIQKYIQFFFCIMLCESLTLIPAYAAKEEKKDEITAPFLRIGPFHICIIKNYEIMGYIRLTIELMFDSIADAQAIAYMAPRLQNQYIIDFSEILSQFWIGGATPDLSHVKTILKRITDNTLGPNKVKDVLFQTYFFAEPPKDDGATSDAASKT